jgi:hypothetical protein
MHRVQKPSTSECCTPLSEPFNPSVVTNLTVVAVTLQHLLFCGHCLGVSVYSTIYSLRLCIQVVEVLKKALRC